MCSGFSTMSARLRRAAFSRTSHPLPKVALPPTFGSTRNLRAAKNARLIALPPMPPMGIATLPATPLTNGLLTRTWRRPQILPPPATETILAASFRFNQIWLHPTRSTAIAAASISAKITPNDGIFPLSISAAGLNRVSKGRRASRQGLRSSSLLRIQVSASGPVSLPPVQTPLQINSVCVNPLPLCRI